MFIDWDTQYILDIDFLQIGPYSQSDPHQNSNCSFFSPDNLL